MKKTISFIFSIALMIFLAACAGQTASGTATPTGVVYTVAETSMATPTIGTVEVLKVNNVEAIRLLSRPDNKAAPTGIVQPGDRGKVLGVDASGAWVLVKIKDQIGWLPVAVLNVTIAK
jgi:hypothetical protein